MKSIRWVFIVFTIFSFSCQKNGTTNEKPTIGEEEMAHLAADVHIIEAHLQNIPANQRDSVRSILYHQLFKIHEVDSTTFYENQMLYYKNPKGVEELYGRVLEILDERAEDKEAKK